MRPRSTMPVAVRGRRRRGNPSRRRSGRSRLPPSSRNSVIASRTGARSGPIDSSIEACSARKTVSTVCTRSTSSGGPHRLMTRLQVS